MLGIKTKLTHYFLFIVKAAILSLHKNDFSISGQKLSFYPHQKKNWFKNLPGFEYEFEIFRKFIFN